MNVKNIILGIGIVVVFALVLWQGIETFYSTPQWEDYCNSVEVPQPIGAEGKVDVYNNQTYCLEQGGEWKGGYCDFYSECQAEYDNAMNKHSWWVFTISLVVAVIVILVGFSILSIEPIGSALIGSGIWAIFWGSVVNWRNFGEIWRFLILLLAFVVLIWVAWRLNSKKKKSWMFWK